MREIEKKLEMPSLSGLDASLRGKRELGRILGAHGSSTSRGLQIADGYVRLVEKTIIEYESARREMVSFMAGGVLGKYFRAQDHFETCLQALYRAIIYLDRIRRLDIRHKDGTPFEPRPPDLEVLSEGVRSRLEEIRDACVDLDEDIINERIPEDAEVAICLGWDCARLADKEICYDEISKWIIQLYQIAVPLSRVEVVVNNTGGGNKGKHA
jgi:hypothetical protein